MRKATLLYNPNSGGKSLRRQEEVEAVVAMLTDAKVEAQLVLTDSSAAAEGQARQAVQSGCDTVFACGGDGTIHTILQVLGNTPVALAILPMGTANALAHDLGAPIVNVVPGRAGVLISMPARDARELALQQLPLLLKDAHEYGVSLALETVPFGLIRLAAELAALIGLSARCSAGS